MQNGNGNGKLRLVIPEPPKGVFAYNFAEESNTVQQNDPLYTPRQQKERIYEIERFDFPETGGQYVYHKGLKYPQRGFPYPRALQACEAPKRILINFLGFLANKDLILMYLGFVIIPRKIKARIIERWMEQYLETADRFLIEHYLKDRFLTPICQELKTFTTIFLIKFGISIEIASRFANTFVTLIEYDTAYRLRIGDILSVTTVEQLLANPIRETARLIGILAKRDPSRPHLVQKFNKFALLMKYGFFFIRKPFREALMAVDFKRMQFDDIDIHMVKHWVGYDFMGMTIEERIEKYPLEHAHYAHIR